MSDNADAEIAAASARRRTWVAGGILLLLSVLVYVVARGPLAAISPAKDWLFAAAGIVSAVGLGRAGSVTDRGIVGTTSTILLVVAPLTQSFWFGLVPDTSDPHAEEDAWALTAMAYFGLLAVVAVVAVVSIGLAAVIPSPWRWAPAWLLVWTPIAYVTGLTLVWSPSPTPNIGSCLMLYGPAAGTVFLGILGIILGLRAPRARSASSAEPTTGRAELSPRGRG
ncbi:hypothetical protein [Microbacterium hydrocarbonoxydans]|uniref:hypothetical protein n=1 Tax=Microbacterium hydrocarbonoxydans TaxID=273678 RepID=UPI00203B11F0|nr:hypothetical protein [Microbacterium hydrocarbonoxydans]MCM3781133.1 hypothetical protein [Microbacterium hydrocarbonoxydans]